MITRRTTPAIHATSKPGGRHDFTCARCGTHRQAYTAKGCPWCADCRTIIAIDPAYLTQTHPPHEAQELLDKWINHRPGCKRRTLAAI